MHPNTQKVVARLAELGAAGEVRELPEAAPTAIAAAEQVGCDVGAIANSLVFAAELAGDDGAPATTAPVLVLTSGAHKVDTAKVAALIGAAKVGRATPEFVRAHTGQAIGGVAPLGHPAPVPTLVDVWLREHPEVWAAAGHPHTLFPTSFAELVRMTSGTAADIGAG